MTAARSQNRNRGTLSAAVRVPSSTRDARLVGMTNNGGAHARLFAAHIHEDRRTAASTVSDASPPRCAARPASCAADLARVDKELLPSSIRSDLCLRRARSENGARQETQTSTRVRTVIVSSVLAAALFAWLPRQSELQTLDSGLFRRLPDHALSFRLSNVRSTNWLMSLPPSPIRTTGCGKHSI